MSADYILSFDFGVINTCYCLIEISTLRIIRLGLFSIKDNTHEGSCKKLATQLKELDLLKNCTKVLILIEQQPRVNIKTIIISGQLQMFYTLVKMGEITYEEEDDKGAKRGTITKIVNYHAKNKLKYYEPVEGDEPLKLDHLSKGHYKNKKTAEQHCDRVLRRQEQNAEWLTFFLAAKKKDDLADAILMAFSYIKYVIKT
jgi:hypothetical protein